VVRRGGAGDAAADDDGLRVGRRIGHVGDSGT
jgi:hypothetical protein